MLLSMGDTRTRVRVGNALLLLAAAWPWLLAAGIALADASRGHPLQAFTREYAGGGSCKIRGDSIFELLLLVGLTGFPVGLAAAVAAARRRSWSAAGLAGGGCVALVLLGFAGPALGICP